MSGTQVRPADPIRALLAERLGVTATADLATVTVALDRALAERPFAGPPAGSQLVDDETMVQLRADAEAGREVADRALLAEAIRTGRIPPASRQHWASLLASGDPNARRTLQSIPAGTIPVAAMGHGGRDQDRDAEADLLAEVYPD